MVRTTWVLLISLAVALTQFSFAQTATKHKSRKAKPVKQVELQPLPPGPLPQVPLDQLPAVPPQVSYQNGSLTIVAENSTLGDILRDVRKQTGASIDVPGSASERVATRLGPGPAREVLATLLNGTSFNYVMVGSTSDPMSLSSVVLTPRPAGGAVQTAQAQPPTPVYTAPDFGPGTGRPGFVPPQTAQVQMQPAENNEEDKEDEDADNSDQEQQAEGQPNQQGAPGQGMQLPQVQQQPDGTDANGQPNAGPRTPQQILQMLQLQRQQLQQQQQQQQQQNQNPPPQEQ